MKECCKTYLTDQFGDEDVVNEIYGEYVSSIEEKLAEAVGQLESAEWDALDKTAHAMKGNALAAGDNDMADCAIALRREAKLQNVAPAADLLARMKDLQAQL